MDNFVFQTMMMTLTCVETRPYPRWRPRHPSLPPLPPSRPPLLSSIPRLPPLPPLPQLPPPAGNWLNHLEEDETTDFFENFQKNVADPARMQDCYTNCDILSLDCHVRCAFRGDRAKCHRNCGSFCKKQLCVLVVGR